MAFQDARRGGHRRKALTLMSWNDLEIRHRGKFRYSVQEDGCKQGDASSWGRTVLTVDQDKPARLPVVDVAMRDVGDAGQKFRLELGPVCFA